MRQTPCWASARREADAVLGIRQEGASQAVEKMENSIQNIILQEMEQLDGIMIATTNLTQNLDKAFERRFLYKIEFEKPSTEAKSRIWRSMIPTLDERTAAMLAARYDFSGGQIENIARKRTIDIILQGAEPSFEQLDGYCRLEVSKALGCKRVHDDRIAGVTFEENALRNALIVNEEYAWVGNPFSAPKQEGRIQKVLPSFFCMPVHEGLGTCDLKAPLPGAGGVC